VFDTQNEDSDRSRNGNLLALGDSAGSQVVRRHRSAVGEYSQYRFRFTGIESVTDFRIVGFGRDLSNR